jgi:butyrate kinase
MTEDTIHRILVINPGSTSTKIALFHDTEQVMGEDIVHPELDLAAFARIWDQYEYRKKQLMEFLKDSDVDLGRLSAVVGRGGLVRPIIGGTYRVNQTLIDDCRAGLQGEHASNLGAILAFGIAWDLGTEAFVVDPPSVDEFEPLARYSGLPELPRRSLCHALNVRAVSRIAARELGKAFSQVRLVIAHLGGGISITALKNGRIADNSFALGDGPFTPERAGTLPMMPFANLCYSNKYTLLELKRKLTSHGGMVAYLGTKDLKLVEERIVNGDRQAQQLLEAMAYQIAKEIGAMATVLSGKLDSIVLTGGAARSELLVDLITQRVATIAPIKVYPGQDEMRALALGCLRVLRREEEVLTYPQSAVLYADDPDSQERVHYTTVVAQTTTERAGVDHEDAAMDAESIREAKE